GWPRPERKGGASRASGRAAANRRGAADQRPPRQPILTRRGWFAISRPDSGGGTPVKRFEFSLDRLLKVKRQLERLAELEQHRAREAVDRARAVLEDLRGQLNRVSEQFAASVGRPMAAHQWSAAAD